MARTLYQGVTTPAASVTVYWAGTTTKPTIYIGPLLGAKSNPITADALGNYSFWVDDGHYKIVNGTIVAGVAADLTDVRIEYPESRISAKDINLMPYLGVATQTLEAWYEGLSAGTGLVDYSIIKPATDSTSAVQVTKADGTTAVMTFDTTNGRVGIGTSSPAVSLEIASNQALRFRNAASDGYTISQIGTNSWGWTGLSGGMFFNLQNSDFIVTAPGHIGIGTTVGVAPTASLDILDTTLAGSAALAGSVLNLAQTWNTTGTPTAIKLNVTNTASNAASLLADFQASTVSKVAIGLNAVTFGDAVNFVFNATTGTKIGTATTQKIGFWNVTPVIQPASAAQAAVATTGSTQTTPFGFTTAAQANGIVALLNEIQRVLVLEGLMKGSA